MTSLTLSVPVCSIAVPEGTALPPVLAARSQAQRAPADEELISAISLGAEWALEDLYQRYYRYAYAMAYRILHEATSAEDIVQEAFLAIWRKADSYQKQHGSVYSWLQAIVHHRAIDKIRTTANRDRQWVPLQPECGQDPPSEQLEAWEEVWQQEQAQMIRAVLEQLPAEQRVVIEQAYFGGFTHAEIAEKNNIPLGTVKGRMRLGVQKMRRLLEEKGLADEW